MFLFRLCWPRNFGSLQIIRSCSTLWGIFLVLFCVKQLLGSINTGRNLTELMMAFYFHFFNGYICFSCWDQAGKRFIDTLPLILYKKIFKNRSPQIILNLNWIFWIFFISLDTLLPNLSNLIFFVAIGNS